MKSYNSKNGECARVVISIDSGGSHLPLEAVGGGADLCEALGDSKIHSILNISVIIGADLDGGVSLRVLGTANEIVELRELGECTSTSHVVHPRQVVQVILHRGEDALKEGDCIFVRSARKRDFEVVLTQELAQSIIGCRNA